MQTNQLITNPFTKHLRDTGSTLRGWSKVNNESHHMVNQVVNCGKYNESIVKKIREQGLYEKLPPLVRKGIEAKELEKYGEEQANNLKRDELLVGDPE